MAEKKITFRSLPTGVQKALKLLKKKKRWALLGVGHHGSANCPVYMAYNVNARSLWRDLDAGSKSRLEKKGWNGRIYNSFIDWYDTDTFFIKRPKKEDFLREYLSR